MFRIISSALSKQISLCQKLTGSSIINPNVQYSKRVAVALRSKKAKSDKTDVTQTNFYLKLSLKNY